jgi:DNA-binding beta-propeller fold protein YncE
MQARKTLDVINVAPQIQRISISIDDSMIFTSDTAKPQLAVIDAATRKVKTWIPLPGLGYGSASTPDGHWLVIAIPSANKVAVIDLTTMKVAQEILMRPDGKMAYASCDASHKVAAINTSTWKVDKLIEVGAGADGLAWAGK